MNQIFTITGTTMTVLLPSELDHHSSEQIKVEIEKLVPQKNIRCLVFDFQNTVFMDSSGIGMMLNQYKNMRFMGGNLLAIRVQEPVERIMVMSGIYRVIDIYENIPEYMNDVRGQ